MLYVISGRLDAEGFVVASLLDRPLVPIIMAVLWSNGFFPARWRWRSRSPTSPAFCGRRSPGVKMFAMG